LRSVIRSTLLVLPAWCWGCSGISVSVDYDAAATLQLFKSFAWKEDGAPSYTPADRRVRRSLESQLQTQGYAPAKSHPDFLVSYSAQMVGFKRNELLLIVDFCDPATKNSLWRGTARATLNLEAPPEEQDARIRAVAAHLMQQFPPR
jgi:hypothetical protein